MSIQFSAGGRHRRSNDCTGLQDRQFPLPVAVECAHPAVRSKMQLHPKGVGRRVPIRCLKNDSSRHGRDALGLRGPPQRPPPSDSHPADTPAWKCRLTVRSSSGPVFLPRVVRNTRTHQAPASARPSRPRLCSLASLETGPGNTPLLPMSRRRQPSEASSGRAAEKSPGPRRAGFASREFLLS